MVTTTRRTTVTAGRGTRVSGPRTVSTSPLVSPGRPSHTRSTTGVVLGPPPLSVSIRPDFLVFLRTVLPYLGGADV